MGYDQTIKVKARYYPAAKNFFSFLQAVGRRFSRPVKIRYRYLERGRFYVNIDGGSGGIDALFQELILNRGLYYYACTIRSSKKEEILSQAVVPLFQGLLEERFPNPYSRFLRKHMLGKISQEKFVPGYFEDSFSHEYEILLRKWDLGSIDNWNFIKDADSLLTRFMLTKLGHKPGQRSPKFNNLVEKAYVQGLGMAEEIKDVFKNAHRERTSGLHRLKTNLTGKEFSDLVFRIYNYFQFFDEFQQSQNVKTEKLHGKRYRRIKYGNEIWRDENGEPYKNENGQPFNDLEFAKNPCHDCAAIRGQLHCFGCDVEQCPRCKGQFLSCGCKLQKDYD